MWMNTSSGSESRNPMIGATMVRLSVYQQERYHVYTLAYPQDYSANLLLETIKKER
jgi:hypothetical protein